MVQDRRANTYKLCRSYGEWGNWQKKEDGRWKAGDSSQRSEIGGWQGFYRIKIGVILGNLAEKNCAFLRCFEGILGDFGYF